MADLGTETVTRSNLLTAHVPLLTDKVYPVLSGEVLVYGEAVKLVSGKLVSLAATTDTPFTIMMEAVDATGGDAYGAYMTQGSVLGSEIVFAAGALADFRNDFATATQILVEG